MLSRCSACRQMKPAAAFNKNRSSKRGLDCYCIECRAQYYKTGRVWPNAVERAKALLAQGMYTCSCCKQTKPVTAFYEIKTNRHGLSFYCRECNKEKCAKAYASPKVQDRVKAYRARPDVVARTTTWKRATPRHMLSIGLNRALKRRPTSNPITLDELFALWREQSGTCAVSGIRMTWASGPASATSLSIDRIDSSKGYSRDNVRLICNAANRFRGNGSDDDMLTMARAITAHLNPSPPAASSAGLLSFGA